MSDDSGLVGADATQLQRWAFGRAESDADRERAAAALVELGRRDAAARAEAMGQASAIGGSGPHTGVVGAQLVGSAPESEHPVAEASRHDSASTERAVGDAAPGEPTAVDAEPVDPAVARQGRRMLATGLAGVLAAVLATPVVATLLTLPDPDPLAIFERPASELDEEWAVRLEQNFLTAPTLGPRVFEVDGLTLVAFRASTVPDGRSTEWDAYCIASTTSVSGLDTPDLANLSLNCVHAQRFEHEGIEWVKQGNVAGEGFDVVRWGPTGPPRVERVDRVRVQPMSGSVLDWMAYPNPPVDGANLLSLVSEPERLLMGPSSYYIADGDGVHDVDLAIYVRAPRSSTGEPELCLAATARNSPTATGCRPLSEGVEEGVLVYAPATEGGWNVVISPDGSPSVERVGVVLD